MSIIAIKRFINELDTMKHRSGSGNESSIRQAVQLLIDEYARGKNLRLIPEVSIKGRKGKTVTPDGTLKDALVLDWGYWESKDEFDDLELEIAESSIAVTRTIISCLRIAPARFCIKTASECRPAGSLMRRRLTSC